MKLTKPIKIDFKFRVVFEPNVAFLASSIGTAYKLVNHIHKDPRHVGKLFRIENIADKTNTSVKNFLGKD